jgi:hypothetical protein
VDQEESVDQEEEVGDPDGAECEAEWRDDAAHENSSWQFGSEQNAHVKS